MSASADPDRVRATQDRLGRDRAGSLVEAALAEIAKGLVQRGVRRLVVAGGETSVAVVQMDCTVKPSEISLKIRQRNPMLPEAKPPSRKRRMDID